MASVGKVAKRVPLIKFPNRRSGETHGAKAVSQASGGGESNQATTSHNFGGGNPQAMSSPNFGGGSSEAAAPGTASIQPPRTQLTVAEIEVILLGGATP